MLAPLLLLPSRSNDRITLEYALPGWSQQSVDTGPTASHVPEEIRTTPLSESVEHTPTPEPMLPAPAVSYEDPSILSLISLPGWCGRDPLLQMRQYLTCIRQLRTD